MKKILCILTLAAALFQSPAFAGEIIIWYDDAGVVHQAASPEEIPPRHRPQARGILTTLNQPTIEEARRAGAAVGSDPLLYAGGLGLFQQFPCELDEEKFNGYVFVGTKFNLVKARAAVETARGGKVPAGYISNVLELESLPVAFHSGEFEAVLLMLTQDGNFIKGDDGFPKDKDPMLKVPAFVKTFPYEALDFSKPVSIQVYDREGRVVEFTLELSSLR